MDIGERRGRLGRAVAAAVVGAVIGVAGCRPMPTAASGGGTRPAVTATVTAGGGPRVPGPAVAAAVPGRVAVPLAPDGAPDPGRTGRGATGTGTYR